MSHQQHAIISEHLTWCLHMGLRPSTVAQRRWHVDRLAGALHGRHEPVALLDAEHEHLREWESGLTAGPQSRASAVKHARSFYRWAVDLDRADPRLLRHLVPPKLPNRLPRPIPVGDLVTAIADADDRMRPWLVLAGFSGLRACEVAPLRVGDVDLSATPPTVFVADGQGGKQRVVPLGPVVAAELKRLGRTRGWLFPVRDRQGHEVAGTHVSASQVSHLASKYLHASGSVSTFHALRHRLGTDVWAEGRDVKVPMELLGHAGPRTSFGYAALTPGRSAEVIDRIGQRWQEDNPQRDNAA